MKLILTTFVLAIVATFSLHAQHVGVGTDTPAEFFSVGGNSQYRVNANGNLVRINDVQYNFPAIQATSGSILANDGSGNLSWTKVTTGNISATGTANNTTFLRGDGAWSAPAGGGSSVTLIAVTSGSAAYTTTPVTLYSTTATASGLYQVTGYAISNLGQQPYGIVRLKVAATTVGMSPAAYIGLNNNNDSYTVVNLAQILQVNSGNSIVIELESGAPDTHTWSFTLVKLN